MSNFALNFHFGKLFSPKLLRPRTEWDSSREWRRHGYVVGYGRRQLF